MKNSNPPICLKIRGGVEVDSYGKKAGKGALLSENLSMTLGVSQDQYLFQPIVIDPVGGQAERARQTDVSPTLKATHYKFPPSVCYSIEPGASKRLGGHILENVSGTLRATMGDNQMSVAYSVENHPSDGRCRIDDSGIVQTLRGRMGTGGGNEPLVMLEHKVFDARGNGDGEITATITGVHEHSISDYTNVVILRLDNGSAYPVVCGDKSPTIRRGNGPGGTGHVAVCYETSSCFTGDGRHNGQITATIVGDHENRITDMTNLICLEGNGQRPSHQGDGYRVTDKMYTLNTIDRHAVCYGISSMGSNAMLSDNPHSGIYEAKTSRTLDLNGGNPACNQGGIIVCQYWDGSQTAGTLTANNAGGSQRMPDKENFNCVIQMRRR